MFQKIAKHRANDVHRPPLHAGINYIFETFNTFFSNLSLPFVDPSPDKHRRYHSCAANIYVEIGSWT